MSNANWPSWLGDMLPDWLEETGYPETGVGDLTDLRLTVSSGEGGRWIGFVNTGWYYAGAKEQYHYVLRGETSHLAAAGSGSISETVSFRPAWGPIQVSSASDDRPYVQHHNSFLPGYSLSWASAGEGLYYAGLPTNSVLIGMRDLSNYPLGAVAGSGELINGSYYWHDEANERVYVRPDEPPVKVWADILLPSPVLRMRELVVQEEDGVRASYRGLEDLKIIRGDSVQSIGTWESGPISHTLPDVDEGDWVVLDYWVRRSFVLKDHNLIQYYGRPASGETIRVHFENSLPDLQQGATLATGQQVNFNPLYSDSYRAGYLFHAENYASPASGLWEVGRLLVGVDKDEVVPGWREPVKFTAMLLDRNDLPIPWFPATVTYSAGASGVVKTPAGNTTDGRGEIHGLVIPGSGDLTITVTAGDLTQSVTVTRRTPTSQLTQSRYESGQALLVVETRKTARGNRVAWAAATFLDGIPKATTAGAPIDIVSERSVALEWRAQTFADTMAVYVGRTADNPFCLIGEMGVSARPGDGFVARQAQGQSPIVRIVEGA